MGTGNIKTDLPPITWGISRYIADARYEAVPERTIHEAKRAWLNTLGVGIAGCRAPEVELLLEHVREMGTRPCAAVWTRDERVSIDHACLIHGTACHVLDFDDTHLAAMVHPSPPVLPAVFAAAAVQPLAGRDALLAFLLGIEITLRIGEAVKLTGFHPTALLGNLGAAVAAGKALSLSAEHMVQAFGLAGTQAAGLVGMNGTASKSFHVGKAAMNGFIAARLAARGLTSRPDTLDGRFARAYSTETDPARITKDLGQECVLFKNSYKPFACGVVAHPAIDAALQIRAAHAPAPEQISAIECEVCPTVVGSMGIAEPRDPLQARFSSAHSIAVAFVRGRAGLAEYEMSAIQDAQVRGLTARVRLIKQPTFNRDQASMRVRMADGREFDRRVDGARGSIQHPLSDDELEQKFTDCVEPVLGAASTRALAEMVWAMDRIPDLGAMEQMMTGAQG